MRNRTPPYITAQPEVTHRRLEERRARGPRFLVLSSDGFADLCSGEGQQRIVASWAESILSQPFAAGGGAGSGGLGAAARESPDNMALRLLRRALGDDRYSVSRVLTLDMDVAWIDDTAIVVQTL